MDKKIVICSVLCSKIYYIPSREMSSYYVYFADWLRLIIRHWNCNWRHGWCFFCYVYVCNNFFGWLFMNILCLCCLVFPSFGTFLPLFDALSSAAFVQNCSASSDPRDYCQVQRFVVRPCTSSCSWPKFKSTAGGTFCNSPWNCSAFTFQQVQTLFAYFCVITLS